MIRHTRRRVLQGFSAGVGLATGLAAAPSWASEDLLRIGDLNEEEDGVTDLARRLAGTRVSTYGFMTPPLRAHSSFFVLADVPMAVCPFCESAGAWQSGILPVRTKRVVEPVEFWRMIEVRGRLVVGESRDPETGFVSLLHVEDASWHPS